MYGFNLNEMNYTVYNLRGVGLCMALRACLDAMISLKLSTYECGISKTDVQSDVTLFSKCVVDEKYGRSQRSCDKILQHKWRRNPKEYFCG